MKNLILAATLAVTAFSAVESQAGGCQIRPIHPPVDCHVRPIVPPVHCEVTLPPPPVCQIRPIQPVYPPPQPVCVIRPCEPVQPVCRIRPCEPVQPHVCELPKTTCTIRPCEPQPACQCQHQCTCQKTCTISCAKPEPVHPVYPVEPTYPAETPPVPAVEIPSGQEVTIDGTAFGFQPGRVVVEVGGMQLEAQVTNWTNEQVRAVMPQLPLASATAVTVVVLGADGNVANQLTAQLVPGQSTPGIPASQALASR